MRGGGGRKDLASVAILGLVEAYGRGRGGKHFAGSLSIAFFAKKAAKEDWQEGGGFRLTECNGGWG